MGLPDPTNPYDPNAVMVLVNGMRVGYSAEAIPSPELLEAEGAWLVEVLDDSGAIIDAGVGDNPEDALLGVAERLLPPP